MDFKTARLHSWEGNLPSIGEHLKTKRGSVYLIIEVKINTNPNPKTIAKLGLIKLTPDDISQLPEEVTFHHFKWG